MKLNRSVAQIIVFMSLSIFASQTFAAPPEGKGKGGKPGSGGGGATECFVKEPTLCDEITAVAADLSGSNVNGYVPYDNVDEAPWKEIFREEFVPGDGNVDQSGSFDLNTWSSRYPYGDVKVNKPAGDSGYNVNTTGIRPGEGWEGNHYPDYDKLLTQLELDGQSVFSNSNEALTIQTFEKSGSWKNKLISRETLFSGIISSHANPENETPHGFEFRYGYVEAKVKLPAGGNGFRSAVWLHSDNSFYNQFAKENNLGIPERYEIDFLEYLPNSRESECFRTQSDVFGLTDNTSILTYDTIFHTYHFPDGADGFDRSQNNWTFNADQRYNAVRCAIEPYSSKGIDYAADWHYFGVLWEHNKLEFYVDGVKVHSVVEDDSYPDCTEFGSVTDTCHADVYDSRMYIVASMHMGFQWFEGNTIDMATFDSATGAGPKMEIDYIKVLQKVDATNPPASTSHSHCGFKSAVCGQRENNETL